MRIRKRYVLASLALFVAIGGGAWWIYHKLTYPGPMDPPKATLPAESPILAVTYSPNGRYLAAADYSGITIWDCATRELWRTLPTEGAKDSIAYSPNGALLASPASNGRAIVWDVEKVVPRYTFQCEQPDSGGKWFIHVRAVCFSPDGLSLAARTLYQPPEESTRDVRYRAGICVWELATGKTRWCLVEETSERHEAYEVAASVAFSPDGKLIAATSSYEVKLWDAVTGKRLASPPEHSDDVNRHRVSSIHFTPRGESIIYGGDTFNEPDVALVWEFATKKERRISGPISRNGTWGWVRCLALSPDGRTLASAELIKSGPRSGRRIRLFDVSTGETLRTYWHDRDLLTLAFSPDGTEFAVGCDREFKEGGQKGAVCIWEVPPR